MAAKSGIHQWRLRLWMGLQMSKGWFWIALNVVLSGFTASTIVWVLLGGGQGKNGSEIPAIIAGILFIILVLLVFIQAPYRGQLKETERVERELMAEKDLHTQTQEQMKPLLALEVAQLYETGQYIWAMLRPINLVGVGTQPNDTSFLIIRLELISCLVSPLPFNNIRGELRIGTSSPLGWVEFMSSSRELPRCGKWVADEQFNLSDSQLRYVEQLRDLNPEVRFDVRIELQNGTIISIPGVQPLLLKTSSG